jgi:xylulokinase
LWLPYLAGERVPDLPHATATLLGMRAGHLTPGVLYRAALEGTSLNLASGVARLRALGIEVGGVHLVGGAARNDLWRAVLADCLGCPVVPLAEPESAALGAGLQALWCLRRAAGEDVSAHEVAAPWVAPAGDATRPDARRVALYAELLARFESEVQERYGAEHGAASPAASRGR